MRGDSPEKLVLIAYESSRAADPAASLEIRSSLVDQQGRIINIHERAVPGSLDPIAAAGPARAVIELNGGTAAHLGIKPGDRVVYPIFGNAP